MQVHRRKHVDNIKLFDMFAKREAMEDLLKLEFFYIIWSCCIWGGPTFRGINWHGKMPDEVFKTVTTKADRKFLQENRREKLEKKQKRVRITA